MKYVKLFYAAKQVQISLLKHQLKDWQPRNSSPLRFRKGYFWIFRQLLALKKVTWQFRMSKWLAWKFSKDNVQVAISEMKISFSTIFGHFNFHPRYPNRLNSSWWWKHPLRQSFHITRSLGNISQRLLAKFVRWALLFKRVPSTHSSSNHVYYQHFYWITHLLKIDAEVTPLPKTENHELPSNKRPISL